MTYRTDLDAAQKRLTVLLQQKEDLEIEVSKVKRQIAALTELTCDGEESGATAGLNLGGLTEACRTALQATKRPLTITGLKSMLEFFEYPVEKYKSPLASIQTTITRMMDSGEVELVEMPDKNRRGYRWIPVRPANRSDQPFVVCKNADCSQPILLLRSIPQRSYESPIWSLTDAHPNNFACPLCGHVYGYTGPEVRYGPVRPEDQSQPQGLIYGLIEFDCAAQSCEALVVIHKTIPRSNAALANLEIEARSWKLCCHCPDGHVVDTLPPLYCPSSYESSDKLKGKNA